MEAATADASNVNPLALVCLLGASWLMLRGRGETAVRALLGLALFLPMGQQLVIAGLNFHFIRLLILVGVCRVVISGEFRDFRWNSFDKVFLAWALTTLVCGVLRGASGQVFGAAYNGIGVYFLIRILTRSMDQVVQHVRFLAFAAILLAVAMAWEFVTQRNPFAVFGGVPDLVMVRNGQLRCQGPFRHPILAGTFTATLFPLLIGLWWQRDRRLGAALLGILGSVFCTVVARSSGALLTCAAAMGALVLWPYRFHLHRFRRGMVVFIIALAIVMNAPVWYLISRVSELVGGTGWHRSYLIDQAVRHLGEWWLIGTSYTAHWAPGGQVLVVDPNNMDITNHYIAQGLRGGLLGFCLFIGLLVMSFKAIGAFLRAEEPTLPQQQFVWALGATLVAHCTAFVSISYFDQTQVFLFWIWAAIATLPSWRLSSAAAESSLEQAQGLDADEVAHPA